jgi:hypothetical protein
VRIIEYDLMVQVNKKTIAELEALQRVTFNDCILLSFYLKNTIIGKRFEEKLEYELGHTYDFLYTKHESSHLKIITALTQSEYNIIYVLGEMFSS